jgi:hypothetical protein
MCMHANVSKAPNHLTLHVSALAHKVLAPTAPGLASVTCCVPPALQQRWEAVHVQHQHDVLLVEPLCCRCSFLRPLAKLLCNTLQQSHPTRAADVQDCT